MARRNASELIMDITAVNNELIMDSTEQYRTDQYRTVPNSTEQYWADGGDGDGGRILRLGPGPIPIAPRNQISRSGKPLTPIYIYIYMYILC